MKKVQYCHNCDTAPRYCNEKYHIQNIYLHECCSIKQFVISHRNNCSYKLLAAIMFERPDYTLVQKLENDVPFGGKNTIFHSLANSYPGDKQPTDP